MSYGAGLPAFVLVRCVVPSFYARGDTATPVRATMLSVASNIFMKILLVWGLDWGVAGIALGTAFGGWVNLAALAIMARRRRILVATPESKRALIPVLIASAATAAGLFLGTVIADAAITPALPFASLIALGLTIAGGVAGFGGTVFFFRRRLPLGRSK